MHKYNRCFIQRKFQRKHGPQRNIIQHSLPPQNYRKDLRLAVSANPAKAQEDKDRVQSLIQDLTELNNGLESVLSIAQNAQSFSRSQDLGGLTAKRG